MPRRCNLLLHVAGPGPAALGRGSFRKKRDRGARPLGKLGEHVAKKASQPLSPRPTRFGHLEKIYQTPHVPRFSLQPVERAAITGICQRRFAENFPAPAPTKKTNAVIAPHDSMLGHRSPDRENAELADRKMGLLKRAGLFGEDTKGATIKRACTAEELRKAYRLVHDVFLDNGYLRPEPSGLRLRIFETTSETATFIAEKDGEVVGVLSVVGDSPDLGLPSDAAFKPELAALRATGLRLCELTNQAVAEAYRKSAVPTELMRCAVAHGMQAGYHEGIATVSPSHHGFYDLMGFRQLGSERSYSHKLHDPVIALRMDINHYRQPPKGLEERARFIHHFATESNQFLPQVADWGKLARRHFLNADLLEQLFVNDRNFLAECTPEELRILQRRWGQEMFQVVTGIMDLTSLEGRAADSLPAMADPALAGRPLGWAGADEFNFASDLRPSHGGSLVFGRYLLGLATAVSDRILGLLDRKSVV